MGNGAGAQFGGPTDDVTVHGWPSRLAFGSNLINVTEVAYETSPQAKF